MGRDSKITYNSNTTSVSKITKRSIKRRNWRFKPLEALVLGKKPHSNGVLLFGWVPLLSLIKRAAPNKTLTNRTLDSNIIV